MWHVSASTAQVDLPSTNSATSARFKDEVLAFTGQPAEDNASTAAAFASLSPREREILARISAGDTNIDIGRRLFISEKTVRNHVARIFGKLGVRSRAQAIVLAKDYGLPSADGSEPRV